MIALDANVLLRLIVADDPHQLDIARRLVTTERTFVPITVTLECEWVLRSFYRYRRDDIAIAILALTDLDGMTFEHVEGVRWAIDRLVAGADFADMIHVVQSEAARVSSFATFDDDIAPRVGSGIQLSVETLA